MLKKRIRQTATTMFCRNGFKTVSVDDICYALGIAKKTFYLLYVNKDDLVREFVETSFSNLNNSLHEHVTQEDAVSRLKIFDHHLAEFLKIFYPVLVSDLKRYHDASYQIFLDKRANLMACLAAIIELGKRQGLFRGNLDAGILAELRFGELEIIFAKRTELKVSDWNRSHRELFEHYVAGLISHNNGIQLSGGCDLH